MKPARSPAFAFAALFLAIPLAIPACASVLGDFDTHGGANAGGAGGASTSSAGGGPNSGSTSSGCGPEVCDDGVDNDCDGKVDCEDDDCAAQSYACAPAAPPGWTPVAQVPDPQGSCPAGFANPTVVMSAPGPAVGNCACSCGAPEKNPCTEGLLNVAFGHNTCANNMFNLAVTGGCDAVGMAIGPVAPVTPYLMASGKPLAVTQTACAATAQLPPSPLSSLICDPTSTSGKGCPGGAVCQPVQEQCLRSAGDVPCPSPAYSMRSVVYAASDVKDNRTCGGGCSCQSDATSCAGATLTTFNDPACTVNPVSFPVVGFGICQPLSGDNQPSKFFLYKAAANVETCSPKGALPPVIGSIAVTNPITVCCP